MSLADDVKAACAAAGHCACYQEGEPCCLCEALADASNMPDVSAADASSTPDTPVADASSTQAETSMRMRCTLCNTTLHGDAAEHMARYHPLTALLKPAEPAEAQLPQTVRFQLSPAELGFLSALLVKGAAANDLALLVASRQGTEEDRDKVIANIATAGTQFERALQRLGVSGANALTQRIIAALQSSNPEIHVIRPAQPKL